MSTVTQTPAPTAPSAAGAPVSLTITGAPAVPQHTQTARMVYALSDPASGVYGPDVTSDATFTVAARPGELVDVKSVAWVGVTNPPAWTLAGDPGSTVTATSTLPA